MVLRVEYILTVAIAITSILIYNLSLKIDKAPLEEEFHLKKLYLPKIYTF